MEDARKRELLTQLVSRLMAERGQAAQMSDPIETATTDELWALFRALVNTRPPWDASPDLISMQDELLHGLIAEKGVSTLDDTQSRSLGGRIRLWLGDITTLAVDTIVNAANSQMLGCWQPGHHCIDNAIHTFAGIQLRAECARLMNEQGHEEPTGSAKITGAYNLPSRHVIHTVGPIANGNPTELHREQLASCYMSCLDLAAERHLSSIAFCCISTGVFGFPAREAAHIAIHTTRAWLRMRPDLDIAVVFNVFSESDEAIYEELLADRDFTQLEAWQTGSGAI